MLPSIYLNWQLFGTQHLIRKIQYWMVHKGWFFHICRNKQNICKHYVVLLELTWHKNEHMHKKNKHVCFPCAYATLISSEDNIRMYSQVTQSRHSRKMGISLKQTSVLGWFWLNKPYAYYITSSIFFCFFGTTFDEILTGLHFESEAWGEISCFDVNMHKSYFPCLSET